MSHVAPQRWAALARGAVGAAEAARLGDHAAGCAACAQARDRVTGAVAAFAEIAATPAPELGWDHIRARIYWATSSERRERMRTAERKAIRRRRWSLAGIPAVAVGAATIAALWYMQTRSGAPLPTPIAHATTPALAPVIAPPVAAPAPLAGVVTLAQGEVDVDGISAAVDVLGHPVIAGSQIHTAGGRLAVQFGDGSSFSVGPGSTLTVRRFDAGAIELALDGGAGDVAIEVAPRAHGQRFAVLAGARSVEVRGTAFRVVRRDRGVDVSCAHGLVMVRDRGLGPSDGGVPVPAGQGFAVGDGEPLVGAAHPLDALALANLLGAVGPRLPVWPEPDGPGGLYRTSAPLAIAAPADHAVRVDGVVVAGGEGPLTLRVMSGRHLVEAETAHGRFAPGEWVEVAPGRPSARVDVRDGAATDGMTSARARATRKAELAAGLDHGRVAVCLRALAKQGIGGTHLELEITVGPHGAIRALNIGDTDLPRATADCVRDAVATTRFAAGPAASWRERLDF